jgi:hypothetical protein
MGMHEVRGRTHAREGSEADCTVGRYHCTLPGSGVWLVWGKWMEPAMPADAGRCIVGGKYEVGYVDCVLAEVQYQESVEDSWDLRTKYGVRTYAFRTP